MSYLFLQADAGRIPLPDSSVDLIIGSPPYMLARTYGRRDVQRRCNDWISWMLDVTAEAVRVSRGLVLWVIGGSTKDWCYQPGPEGLLYRWWAQGGACWRPVIWRKVGIPGSGHKQWFRSDTEYVMAFVGKKGPIPWADNTACGAPPKWAPGGEMSYRLSDGTRTNQWGKTGIKAGTSQHAGGAVRSDSVRPSHESMTKKERGRIRREIVEAGGGRTIYGKHIQYDDDGIHQQVYVPPALANPGNVLDIKTGGGLLGSRLAHENEAPYPVGVPEFFIKSHCPPGGTVLDPFSGSGTTTHAAELWGRHSIGMDLRQGQCALAYRRLDEPLMEAVPLKQKRPRRQPKAKRPLPTQAVLPFQEAS